MALPEFLILRKPRSGCLEERTTLIRPIVKFLHKLVRWQPDPPGQQIVSRRLPAFSAPHASAPGFTPFKQMAALVESRRSSNLSKVAP
jgi:hypothetical protein